MSVAAQQQPFRSPLANRRQRGNGNGNIDNNDADDDNIGGGRSSSDSRHSVCQSCRTPFTVRPLRPLQVIARAGVYDGGGGDKGGREGERDITRKKERLRSFG